jgi:hypothetical protein
MNHNGNTNDGYSNKITNKIRNILSENFIESKQPYRKNEIVMQIV